jgi:hypothetical protein
MSHGQNREYIPNNLSAPSTWATECDNFVGNNPVKVSILNLHSEQFADWLHLVKKYAIIW